MVCKNRVSNLRGQLEAAQKSLEVYLRRHFSNLTPHSVKVRELLFKAMNGGLKDVMTAFATQAGVLFRKHPYAAPPSGTGVPMTTPSFTRLRELVDEGAGTSLVERKGFGGWPPTRQQVGAGERGREPLALGGSERPPR